MNNNNLSFNLVWINYIAIKLHSTNHPNYSHNNTKHNKLSTAQKPIISSLQCHSTHPLVEPIKAS